MLAIDRIEEEPKMSEPAVIFFPSERRDEMFGMVGKVFPGVACGS